MLSRVSGALAQISCLIMSALGANNFSCLLLSTTVLSK